MIRRTDLSSYGSYVMTVVLPDIRVGEPLLCGGLAVFPLFSSGDSHLNYVLAADGMAMEAVAGASKTIVVTPDASTGSWAEPTLSPGISVMRLRTGKTFGLETSTQF